MQTRKDISGLRKREYYGQENMRDLIELKTAIEEFERFYNFEYPHSVIGYKSPKEYFKQVYETLYQVFYLDGSITLITYRERKWVMIVNVFYNLKASIKRVIARKNFMTELSLVQNLNFTTKDLEFSKKLLLMDDQVELKKIIWLVPRIRNVYGGLFTILRIGSYLKKENYEVKFITVDNSNISISKKTLNNINEYFPNLRDADFLKVKTVEEIPNSDIAIATFWTTAYKLLKIRNTRKKIYFIQDFEPSFYKAGTLYALSEQTYFFPFHRIINTKGLYDYLSSHYKVDNTKTMYFTPGIDQRYEYAEKELNKKIKIFFYGRVSAERNAFSLGISALKALKEKYKNDVEIVVAGEDLNFLANKSNVFGQFSMKGNVPYEQLPSFYSQFHIGIVFMFTKHPSYIPLELMKSGCLVVTNFNQANYWLFKDKVNCLLVPPNVNQIVEKISEIISNESLYKRIISNAMKTVKNFDWDLVLSDVRRFINKV